MNELGLRLLKRKEMRVTRVPFTRNCALHQRARSFSVRCIERSSVTWVYHSSTRQGRLPKRSGES